MSFQDLSQRFPFEFSLTEKSPVVVFGLDENLQTSLSMALLHVCGLDGSRLINVGCNLNVLSLINTYS